MGSFRYKVGSHFLVVRDSAIPFIHTEPFLSIADVEEGSKNGVSNGKTAPSMDMTSQTKADKTGPG